MTDTGDFSRLERVIAGIMRVGVAASSSVLLVGLVMALIGLPASTTVLNAGIVLLMLIPATRIVVSLVDAAIRRDLLLAVATAIVILVLTGQIRHWFEFK